MFLDPFDNEDYGGKFGISINACTLVKETNLGSTRWMRGSKQLPTEGEAWAARGGSDSTHADEPDGVLRHAFV